MRNIILLIVAGALIALGATGLIYMDDIWWGDSTSDTASSQSTPSQSALSPVTPNTKARDDAVNNAQRGNWLGAPKDVTFDVVRVDPDGYVVIAGLAPPKARVQVLDGNTVIGDVLANHTGAWVVVVDRPLSSGEHALSLRATTADGRVLEGKETIATVVPTRDKSRGNDGVQSLVVAIPDDAQALTVLQKSSAEQGAETLYIDSIDYDNTGRIVVGGRGFVGREVKVFIGRNAIGNATVQSDTGASVGTWRIQSLKPLVPGYYTVYAEQRHPDNNTAMRTGVSFVREKADVIEKILATGGKAYIVQPGNSLWRIARRTYGRGFRYTVIYEANTRAIRNPDLIHPGQILSLPNG